MSRRVFLFGFCAVLVWLLRESFFVTGSKEGGMTTNELASFVSGVAAMGLSSIAATYLGKPL